LLRRSPQLLAWKVGIPSHGLAITIHNPGATSICMVHGSSSLRISCVKNPKTK
jgi:hypothetical protein